MDDFYKLKEYASNTLASNGNQTVFSCEKPETGMAFFKVFKGGTFPYVFAFSNVIDSTFADGSISKCNDVCSDFRIVKAEVCVTSDLFVDSLNSFTTLTFNGQVEVKPKEITFSDETVLSANKGQYICMKITFSGKAVPCHRESIIPVFRLEKDNFISSTDVPLPVFCGIKRNAEKRIAFIGDSITQGIGSSFNSYCHYAAVCADTLVDKYAYWDLGIGFARGYDAATDGVWLNRAKQNDIVIVCFGVNDILQGRTEEQLKDDLKTITEKLKQSGATVILQTVPPFDYGEEHCRIWMNVNDFIKNQLSLIADRIFDNNTILCEDNYNSPKAKYGPHPNDNGHILWGKALAALIDELLNK